MSKQEIFKKYCHFRKDCKDCDICWTNNIFNESELRRFRAFMSVRMNMNHNKNLELDTINKINFILGERMFSSYEEFMTYFIEREL